MTPKDRRQVEARLTTAEKRKLRDGLARAEREGWSDMVRGPQDLYALAEGCWYEARYADHVVAFFAQGLTHATGSFAGQPFEPLPWQEHDILRPLYGWRRTNAKGLNVRRYTSAFIKIAKKNGKSTLCAGLALYGLVGEPSPVNPSRPEAAQEIYAASTSKEVASIVYRETKKLAKASGAIDKRVKAIDSTRRVVYPEMGSFMRVLPHKADSAEGFLAGYCIFDEVHAMINRKLYAALRYSGASRDQPLNLEITTAGVESAEALWVERNEYSRRMLAGEFRDTTHLAVLYEADPDAALDDLDQLAQANPSLGVTIDPDRIVAEARQAMQEGPAAQADFRRYRMNVGVGAAHAWISPDQWDAGQGEGLDLTALEAAPCLAGLDLAKVNDFTALVLYWPFEAPDACRGWPWFWIPHAAVQERTRNGDLSYQSWADQGLITVTDGDTTDHRQVRADIKKLAERFQITRIGIDRNFDGWQFTDELFNDDELPAVGVGQGWKSQDVPMQRIETLVTQGRLDFGGHPVMRWMMGNAVAKKTGETEAMSLARESRSDKIDGPAALVNAVFLAETTQGLGDPPAVYDFVPLA